MNVNVNSLGFRTDLSLRALEGSELEEHDGYLVIRSPAQPGFWWGNFLLLREPPERASAGYWRDVFHGEFPAADYVALGVDTTTAFSGDLPGFERRNDSVLTASDVRPPARRNRDAEYRPLSSGDDWDRATMLALACHPGGPESRDFLERRIAAKRRLAEEGHGAWFGAFRDRELLAQLGIFRAGTGVARFQDVETHPDARRRGLASSLVHEAAAYAFAVLAAVTLVMVAEPDGDAIRLYRSLGFAPREQQVSLERLPAA